MTTPRWDETWHRLLEWTNEQGPAERLAAQVLLNQGFERLDPSHPLGGKDGGKDAVCTKAGKRWVMGVYFPRGQQSFKDIKEKFCDDLQGAQSNQAEGFAFVTNQELRLAERETLASAWPERVELYHLERLTTILDSTALYGVRKQFLGIDYVDRSQGGRGGDAEAESGGAATGGTGGDAGPFGDGGRGGDAKAAGEGSWAEGGPGGRGGIGSGGRGTDATAANGGLSMGGEGGEAPQPSGRGGRGGRSGAQLLGINDRLPDGRYPGEGGRGANSAAYDGKVATIKQLSRKYQKEHPHFVNLPLDGEESVPLAWLNERLHEIGVNWRVSVVDGEYEFFTAGEISAEVSDTGSQDTHSETTTSTSSNEATPAKPHGIALIICCKITWQNRNDPARSCPRDLFGTFDSWSVAGFPHPFGPLAAYVLLSGAGKIPLSLLLEAPNGEIVVARHDVAVNWGVLGTWEWPVHIDEFQLCQPGIYHWKLCHGEDVLLDRPMVIIRKGEGSPKESPQVLSE